MLGKFNSESDEYVYSVSLEGGCDSAGTVQFRGWAGLVYLRTDDDLPALIDLDASMADKVAAIIQEDGQGFVSVDYYRDEANARHEFTKLAAWLDEGDETID